MPAPTTVPIATTSSTALPPAACASVDPLRVASTFLTAAQKSDERLFRSCVLPPAGIAGVLDAVITTDNVESYALGIASGGYLLSDEFIRDLHTFPKICCTYSFGSPDDPPPSDAIGPQYWIDPNGRADVTVRAAADGKYYVVNASIEFHA